MRRDPAAMREQDVRDAENMAYSISLALHHTTRTDKCQDPTACRLCSNAARLAVQHLRPIVERRTARTFLDYFGAGCDLPHHGFDT